VATTTRTRRWRRGRRTSELAVGVAGCTVPAHGALLACASNLSVQRPTCCHMRRLLYKVRGPAAKLNFGLSDERRAQLDAMRVEELVQSYRQAVKHAQTSRFVGVSWEEKAGKWRAAVSVMRDGEDVVRFGGLHAVEESAARQADE
jgi:hypothetical protein